jgi:capsular polysaccharide transport system permease protein
MTTLLGSASIQIRVIKALLLREIITRWGRKNISFLWLVVEPILFISIFVYLWTLRGNSLNNIFNIYLISPVAFILVGYSAMMLWRNSANLISNAIKSNQSLFYHKNIKPIDIYIARYILEMAGVTLAFNALLIVCLTFEIIPYPDDISLIVLAWGLLMWFSLGFGLTFGILMSQYDFLSVLWRGISIFFFVISGALFFVNWLPIELQKYALLIPMVHGSEMLRHGYFGEIIKTHENPFYLIKWCIFLNLTGLLLAKFFGNRLPENV